MLVVEGSDLVGKTTFVGVMLREMQRRGFPMVPQHFGLIPSGWDYFQDYLPYISKRTVMDRFIMSEIVYGTILRGKPGISPWQYGVLDASLKLDASVTVVLCGMGDWYADHVEHEHLQRHEVFRPDEIIAVNRGFLEIVNSRKFGEYRPYFDFGYVKTDDDDWPSNREQFIKAVADLYEIQLKGLNKWQRQGTL